MRSPQLRRRRCRLATKIASRSTAKDRDLVEEESQFPILKNPAQPRRNLFRLPTTFFDRHQQPGPSRELTDTVSGMLGRST